MSTHRLQQWFSNFTKHLQSQLQALWGQLQNENISKGKKKALSVSDLSLWIRWDTFKFAFNLKSSLIGIIPGKQRPLKVLKTAFTIGHMGQPRLTPTFLTPRSPRPGEQWHWMGDKGSHDCPGSRCIHWGSMSAVYAPAAQQTSRSELESRTKLSRMSIWQPQTIHPHAQHTLSELGLLFNNYSHTQHGVLESPDILF